MITGKTIRGIINYNENKLKEGMAACILAQRFGREASELNFNEKLNRFVKLQAHNPKTKTNAVHISLNFDVSEKLSVPLLREIAGTYMDKLGFGNQPYLVYQHFDAAHPHMHIVTTNVQKNGKRIEMHNIGRNQSEAARKEIEKLFGLVQAQSKTKKQPQGASVLPERGVYGKSETKRGISNAIHYALQYKFTSFPEFNAVLRQFNVVADRGKVGTKMNEKKGLVYSLIDKNENKIGVPIKASSVYGKPTLPNLEKKYSLNEKLRIPHKERLKSSIDKCFSGSPTITQNEFNIRLQKEGIYVVLRQGSDNRIYGVTFVDNHSKTVFNGSDLGKAYSAKALLERISDTRYAGGSSTGSGSKSSEDQEPNKLIELNLGVSDLIKNLVTAEQQDFISPEVAMKIRKRKKKKWRSI